MSDCSRQVLNGSNVISSSYTLPSLRRFMSSPRHISPPRMVRHISSYNSCEFWLDLSTRVLCPTISACVYPANRSKAELTQMTVPDRLVITTALAVASRAAALQLNEASEAIWLARKETEVVLILHFLNLVKENILWKEALRKSLLPSICCG
jgi:hypothetical protein